jgi:serine/threonine-protein kinase
MSQAPHIDNFELLHLLGRGGMASVWKARQTSLDRFVAVKVLSAAQARDPADIARFHEEARAAGRLKHPGIVQVYDANFTNGSYYFIMELVDGYTVGEWIRRKGQIEEADALTVAESVIHALDYAWSDFNMIHCDIKPENIMVDADGTVKITDLGLARAIVSTKAREHEAEVLGTPAYMSPEQATGQSDLDCRADIYALGATLYHMVTGHPLFAGERQEDMIMRNQLVATVANPAQEACVISHGLVLLLTKMLAKDRKYRHKDWKAVLVDIRRVRERNQPAAPLPPSGASTILLTAHESDPARWQTLRAAAAAQLETQEDGASGAWVVRVVLGAVLLLVVGILVWWFALGGSRQVVAPVQACSAVSAVEAAYQEAIAYVNANPTDWRGGLPRLETVLQQAPQSWYAQQATTLREGLCRRREGALLEVCQTLDQQTRDLARRNRMDEALQLLERYQGAYASETLPWRQKQAKLLRAEVLVENAPSPTKAPPPPAPMVPPAAPPSPAVVTEAAAAAQLARSLLQAVSLAQAARQAAELTAGQPRWKNGEFAALQKILTQARDMEQAVLLTFEAEKGKEISVALTQGTMKGVMSAIGDGRVRLAPVNGVARSFTLDELSLIERLRRLRLVDDGNNAGATLLKAIWACRSHAHDRAQTLLQELPAPAGPVLVRVLDEKP